MDPQPPHDGNNNKERDDESKRAAVERAVSTEVSDAVNTSDEKERNTLIQKLIEKTRPGASESRNEMNKRAQAEKERPGSSKIDAPIPGTYNDQESLKHKSYRTYQTITKLLEAFKANPNLIPVAAGTTNRQIIEALLAGFNPQNPDVQITKSLSPFLHKLLDIVFNTTIDNPLIVLSAEDLENIALINRPMYGLIINALTTSAAGKIADPEIEAFITFAKTLEGRSTIDQQFQRGQRVKTQRLNEAEAAELDRFQKKLEDYLKNLHIDTSDPDKPRHYMSTVIDPAKKATEMQQIGEREYIKSLIRYSNEEDGREEFIRYMTDKDTGPGFTVDEVIQYLRLIARSDDMKGVREGIGDRELLESYDIRPADIHNISPDTMIAKFDTYFEYKDDTGLFELSAEGKNRLHETMNSLINKLLSRISATTGGDWQDQYNQYHEGTLERIIRDNLVRPSEDKPLIDTLTAKAKKKGLTDSQIDKSIIRYRSDIQQLLHQARTEKETRQIYFQLRDAIVDGKAKPEQIVEFVRSLPASTIERLMRGYHGPLFQWALTEYQTYLHQKIAFNDNKLPANILSSKVTKYEVTNTDLEEVKDRLATKLEAMKSPEHLKIIHDEITALQKAIASKEQFIVDTEAQLNSLADPEKIRRAQIDIQEAQQYIKTQKYNLSERREELTTLQEYRPWELDRVLILAPGFSLGNSMRAHEIMATADRRTDFAGIFQFAQYFSLWAKWQIGRGRDQNSPTVGFQLPELFDIAVPMKKDERSLFQRLTDKKWIPLEVYAKSAQPGVRQSVEEMVNKLEDMIEKERSIHGPTFETRFHEALRVFNILGFYSRGGWRIEGFKGWLKDQGVRKDHMSAEKGDWRNLYTFLESNVGAMSGWFFNEERASNEMKDFVLSNKYGIDYRSKMQPGEINDVWNSFIYGEFNEAKVIPAKLHQHGRQETETMTVQEFVEEKTAVYKGKNLKALMERSPYDCMINISQLEPELNGTVKIANYNGITNANVTAYEFYFTVPDSQLTEAEKKKRIDFRIRLKSRWGEENFTHLQRIAQFWHDVYNRTDNTGKKSYIKPDGSYDKGAAQKDMYNAATLALAKVKFRRKQKMEKGDFGTDENDKFFAEAFVGDNGLVPYFNNQHEDFGENDVISLGNRGFFYRMGKVWVAEHGPFMFPNTNEMDERIVFTDLEKGTGRDIFVRLWGDLANWNKTVDQLTSLDELLMNASQHNKFEDIYKLHQSVYELKGMLGLGNAQRLNYILATITARYMQGDQKALIGFLRPSLAQLHGDRSFANWGPLEIHNYLLHLEHNNHLAKEGVFSKENLMKQLNADLEYVLTTQGLPLTAMITALIIFAVTVKALQQSEIISAKPTR